MVIHVEPAILDSFALLIPREHLSGLESGEMFCLGALKEEGDDQLPVDELI